MTVFADGLNLATAIQLGYGGVFVGQAPDLLFLEDTQHRDVADKRTVLMTGFGLDDRHELLNGFTWGPDGWLYMTHGVFTHSKVRIPEASEPGVEVNAAVARFHPRTKQFEVFADGTSNPWGVDFDRAGNAFVSACVIDHLFHMAPGGIYDRQGGSPANPYAYQMLPSIVGHRHHMAAYAGIQIYQGDQFPAEWRGEVLMGNIHQSALNHDHLTPNGSSFRAEAAADFLTTTDGWFRPVSEQVGPDGALWVMDWYDKYPCYQNANADPEGVDRERGRIWRVVYTGKNKGAKVPSRPEVKMNLGALPTADLVALLAHPNVWQRRMAQRLLSERRDAAAAAPLRQMLTGGGNLEARLAALWTLHGAGLLTTADLGAIYQDREPALRAWSARLAGERHEAAPQVLAGLATLAGDADPSVRLAVATAARQFASGALTIDTPRHLAVADLEVGRLLAPLVKASADGRDPLLPFMIWQAAEPKIGENPGQALGWLLNRGPDAMPLAGELARKTMRRICDTRSAEQLTMAVEFLGAAMDREPALAAAALDGLLSGQAGKATPPAGDTTALFARLKDAGNRDVRERGLRLGVLWGNTAAIQAVLALVNDSRASADDRVQAIKTVRKLRTDDARSALLSAVGAANPEPVLLEAVRGAGEVGGDAVAPALLGRWPQWPPAVRRAAAEVLVSRPAWAQQLLGALETKVIFVNELSATLIRALTQSRDAAVRDRAASAIGRVRPADADKIRIIAEKKAMILAGTGDPAAGRELARKTCLLCHKFYGEGADVGPDLTGVGRASLDALLANVIDPNQVIGKGYENVVVETKDGRSLSGRMVENTATRVRLLSAGPKEDVVAPSEIASLRVTENSVMPEGLEQMADADFRNLMLYILHPPQEAAPGK